MLHSDDDEDDDKVVIPHVQNIKCNNCGRIGHTIKQCTYPVRSYGIITYYIDDTGKKWLLLVQRKYTYEFCDFIKGNFSNIEQLKYLISRFTEIEKFLIFKFFIGDYVKLFLFATPHKTTNTKTYVNFVNNYTTLFIPNFEELNKYTYDSNHIQKSINLWEIPRGKKNYWEKPINCAMREFSEETGVEKKKLIHRKDIHVVNEKMIGSNGIEYEFSYYVMKLKFKEDVYINHSIFEQHSEIRNVTWIEYNNALEMFKDTFNERYTILSKLKNIVN